MTRENELKFAPPATFAVPEFDEGTGVSVVEKLPPQNLRAIYYDTEDLRLARFGATLRHRSGEDDHSIWTLKLPRPGDTKNAREEINYVSDEKSPPPEILDLATAFIRSDKLVPVTTLKTKRRRWMLRGEAGVEIAELVDDDVSVVEGRKIIGRFRELEVEQRNGSDKEMKRIGAAMRDAGAAEAEPISKAARALALRGQAEETRLDGTDTSAAATFRGALRAALDRLLLHDPVVRLGKSTDGVHQMRVATRRIRSNLKTFAEIVDPAWSDEMRQDLKWLADLLGEVRDLDVLQSRLRDHAEGIEGLRALFDSLVRQHRRARSRLLEGMRSDRYRLLIDNLVRASDELPASEAGATDARTAMGSAIARMWSEVASEVRTWNGEENDEQRHAIRIQTKRLRYAVEAAAAAFGKDSKKAGRFAKDVAHVQDVLGEYQDAVVAQATLTAIATRGTKDAAFCIAVGRLIERETREADRSRAMFSEAWGKLDRKKNLSWLQGG